jgi:hypothetical protein
MRLFFIGPDYLKKFLLANAELILQKSFVPCCAGMTIRIRSRARLLADALRDRGGIDHTFQLQLLLPKLLLQSAMLRSTRAKLIENLIVSTTQIRRKDQDCCETKDGKNKTESRPHNCNSQWKQDCKYPPNAESASYRAGIRKRMPTGISSSLSRISALSLLISL